MERETMAATPYPVTYSIQRPERYNRLTVLFRLILAIPQLILVGAGSFQFVNWSFGNRFEGGHVYTPLFTGGILTFVLGVLVFLAWFAILFTGRFPRSFQGFCIMIYRWSQNVGAYVALLADPYPPFGDGPYPLNLQITPAAEHNRLTTAFRIILVIPHVFLLTFLGLGAGIVTIVAWFAILLTGQYPEGLYNFSVGVARWGARVGAYMYLFVDEYPPFSLADEAGATGLQPETA
jgi:hypothetical protein